MIGAAVQTMLPEEVRERIDQVNDTLADLEDAAAAAGEGWPPASWGDVVELLEDYRDLLAEAIYGSARP